MANWLKVGKLNDIPLQGAVVLQRKEGDIAIFRTAAGNVFALRDSCPHLQGALSQGIVHDNCVTCPLHNYVISLETGGAQGHDEGCTQTFQTKLEGDRVFLNL